MYIGIGEARQSAALAVVGNDTSGYNTGGRSAVMMTPIRRIRNRRGYESALSPIRYNCYWSRLAYAGAESDEESGA